MTPRCFGGDRLAVLAHRRQQLGDAGAVDLIGAEECSQRLMGAADFLEHFALDGGPGKPAELGDELAHRAIAPQVAISGHMRGEITLQPGLVVPMRAGRIARPPFFPIGIGRRHVDELLAEPGTAQSQVRVEPDIALGEPYELASA